MSLTTSDDLKNVIITQFNTVKLPTLPELLVLILENVEKLNINGTNKKKLALELFNDIITLLPDTEYKSVLETTLDSGVIGDMIDLIVNSSRGTLKLNKKSIGSIIIKSLKCCIGLYEKKDVKH